MEAGSDTLILTACNRGAQLLSMVQSAPSNSCSSPSCRLLGDNIETLQLTPCSEEHHAVAISGAGQPSCGQLHALVET